jgi:beta-phosphoglucomutase family hydrolase
LPELDPRRYDAWLFDLDGVLTDTAQLHAAAWKKMFDGFLRERAAAGGEPFEPFTREDYLAHVDGKPRLDGVRDFLASRGIHLPEGAPDDEPSAETVHALGNRKNELVLAAIAGGEVDVYPGSIAFVRRLHEDGTPTAIVSSSRNAAAVIEAAGIEALFDTRVDGVVAAERGLAGKPAPDTFVAAADRLRVAPDRAVVVEDAVSGVRAGRAGGFALVVGVARESNAEDLTGAGADVVVADLSELTFVSERGRSDH